MEDLGIAARYTQSFYWSAATMMAVGYGDLYAVNGLERFYSIIAQMMGAFMFGHIVSTVASVIDSGDAQQAAYRHMVDEVKEYMRFRKFPKKLQKRIKKHLDYRLHVKSVFDEANIYSQLSTTLRDRINRYAYEEVTQKIDFLKGKASGFVTLGMFLFS